ncbi:UNVERIFIED_CONTAM: 50S ribosome-binding GTPase, partial [Bacteroidetes bacterium 56_B9]
KYATKGQDGIRINLQLELKLLADIGLVGLPNAGKSTLMRAITRSRTRVGNWAFTTLAPNIGTLVLDNNVGRPVLDTKGRRKAPRERFTIADIP